MSEKLVELILKSDQVLMMKPVEDVQHGTPSITVIKVSLGVRRTELTKVSQGHDEAFCTFSARVRGKAETCNFRTLSKCSCIRSLKPAEEII